MTTNDSFDYISRHARSQFAAPLPNHLEIAYGSAVETGELLDLVVRNHLFPNRCPRALRRVAFTRRDSSWA